MEINKEEILLAQAIRDLPGSIMGYNEDMGVYELCVLASAGTDIETRIEGVGKNKLVLERGRENYMRFSLVSRHLRWLMGEILTIIDAIITNERQLKATKDLIRSKFSAKISWLYEQCGCPEEEEGSLMEPVD